MWRILFYVGFLVSCTKKESQISSPVQTLSICQQQVSSQACLTFAECTLAYGTDLGTREDVYMECELTSYFPDNDGPISCYQSASGQKVIRNHAYQFAKWTEIACAEEEKKSFAGEVCDVSSEADCPLNKGCALYKGRDTVSNELVVIGCLKGGSSCGQAFTCFENKQRTRRIVATESCPKFEEWEYVSCSSKDLKR